MTEKIVPIKSVHRAAADNDHDAFRAALLIELREYEKDSIINMLADSMLLTNKVYKIFNAASIEAEALVGTKP